MSVISVTGKYATGRNFLAKELSSELGFRYAGSRELSKTMLVVADGLHLPGLDEDHVPSVFERLVELGESRNLVMTAFHAAVYSIALEGNTVFAGSGTGFMLCDIPGVISVMVVRLLSERVRAIADVKKIPVDEALELIEIKDRHKKEMVEHYFDRDMNDPLPFHMLLNASRMPADAAVRIISGYASGFFTAESGIARKQALAAKLIEKRAELMLFRLGMVHSFGKIGFEYREGGLLRVKGVTGGDNEKKELLDGLAKLDGVNAVDDHLKVSVLSRNIF